MNKYRFLLMDADCTLLDFDADMYYAFKDMYAHMFSNQLPYSDGLLQCYEKHNDLWWEKFERRECDKNTLFLMRFKGFMEETGLKGDPEKINLAYFEFLGKGGRPLPGAVDMVKRLSEKHDIYIITNGNASTSGPRLENSGLIPYIKDFFISETVGVGKPHIGYFEHVFSNIPDFQKESAVVIGDSLSSDIMGANNAGLDSIWYNPKKAPKRQDIPCTFEAFSFADIEKLLSDDKVI